MTRNLLDLSWAQMTSDERWAVAAFLVRRALSAVAMICGALSSNPALAILGAAGYIDAGLRFHKGDGNL